MPGLLDDIARDQPALRQAQAISQQAVGAGFEWETLDDVWAKVDEEIDEFKRAERGSENQIEELGDILFTLVNVARKEQIDAEEALERACEKFRSRWAAMERMAAEECGCPIDEVPPSKLAALWTRAKTELG